MMGAGVALWYFVVAGGSAMCADPRVLSDLPSESVFKKQTIVLAQTPPESDSGSTSSVQSETPAPASDDDDADQFVFAGDLARTLRRIDPDTTVDWDGSKLKIQIEGQEFAIFPSGEDMVINGEVESGLPPLTIRNGEIYVPQAIVGRIGSELEKTLAPPTSTPEPTPTPSPTPEGEGALEATPTPEATPGSSILPDVTPAATASPSPTASGSILPDMTPATTASPTPVRTPGATAAPTAAPAVATPFPVATPTPTPRPTPTPTPSPTPRREERTEEADRNRMLSAESFKAALQDKISLSTRDVAVFNSSKLQDMAAVRTVSKVLIHPEEGGIERTDEYGKESARLSLEIAQRVSQQLRDEGLEVEMTRTSAEPVTAGEILQTITRSEAQILVVVSVGYSTSFQDLGGYRIFFMNDSVDYNSLRENIYDASEIVPTDMNYKPFQNMSRVLASSLRNSVMTALERDPVGMNPAPLYYVRRAPMASAAVVAGYLSNPADARRLTDPAQQDVLARGLVDGIKNYAELLSQGRAQQGGDS